MKILNVLITLLVISILVSGGFLGYLMYTQDSAVNTPNNDTNNNDDENNITADAGCTTLFEQGNGTTNQLADFQLNFTSSSTGNLEVGDTVTVTASVLSSSPAKKWKGLELRIIFPCENIKFVKSTPGGGDHFAIEVESEYDNVAEVHLATTKDSFTMGDQLVQFEFEVTKEGATSIEVADTTSLIDEQSVRYSIATNKVSL